MKIKNIFSQHLFAILLTGSLFLAACNNPAGDDNDDHHDPFGVALIMNGVEIATQENGVVSYHEGDYLELETGEETGPITIRFIDEDGDRFQPDDEYSLRWTIDEPDVLEVEEDGPWNFHLIGLVEGAANVNFILWHVSGNHEDFTSAAFEVRVSEAAAAGTVQKN